MMWGRGGPFPFLASLDPTVTIGGGGALTLLFGYLFRELHRKDDSVWQIIADRDKQHAREMDEKDKEIARLAKDRDFWRDRTLKSEDDAAQGLVHRQEQRERGEETTT